MSDINKMLNKYQLLPFFKLRTPTYIANLFYLKSVQ